MKLFKFVNFLILDWKFQHPMIKLEELIHKTCVSCVIQCFLTEQMKCWSSCDGVASSRACCMVGCIGCNQYSHRQKIVVP